MGVNLRELLVKRKITLEQLDGKKLAIDAFNILYQFLATIRQPDGTPLMDSSGRITSHLSGLFYRTINLLEAGIKPVFIFDGRAPLEKVKTQLAREKIREEAREKYEEALAAGRVEEARKYAQQTSRLTRDIIQESKELLDAMGIPWVQALAEGEAQAAHMARKGDVWGVASQDYDTLLFAAPRLVRNLAVSGKRRNVEIELIVLAESLNYLGIDIRGLVEIALLIGTDYNPGGVQGMGPKTALKVVRDGKFEEYAGQIPNIKKLKQLFLEPLVTSDYSLAWKKPDASGIRKILVERHDFSLERVNSALKRIPSEKSQKGLGDFMA